MKVLVAGVSAHRQYNAALDSFYKMKLRKGDRKYYRSGGRGDVERTYIAEKFAKEDWDALLLCDLDQKFPADALERLRAHDLDMVSGHYMKRTTKALVSIWRWSTEPMQWPYISYINPPEKGRLHRIATTGMGCVLIKKEPFMEVAKILPPGANPFEIGKIPEIAYYQNNFGSDYRFFYLAQKLGYELWGDPDVECPHAATVWLTRDTIWQLEKARKDLVGTLMDDVFRNGIRATGGITLNGVQARYIMLLNARQAAKSRDEQMVVDGQIAECEMWMAELKENAPPAEALEVWKQRYAWQNGVPEYWMGNLRKLDLPTFGSQSEIERAIETRDKTPEGFDEREAAEARSYAHRNQAANALMRMNGYDAIQPTHSMNPGNETYVEENLDEVEHLSKDSG